MKQTIILHTPAHVQRAKQIIDGLSLGGEYEVVIREHKKDRSAAQNALYWQWLTIIGATIGELKEAVHERYKDVYLVHIYERDDIEYAQMVQSLREVWKHGMKAEAISLRKQIVSLTSTTTATVKQFTEYLQSIEQDAISMAISLPHPDDLYNESMGIKP